MEFKKKIIFIVVLGFVIVVVLMSGMLFYSENNMVNEIEIQLMFLMQQWVEQIVSVKLEVLVKEFQVFFDEVEVFGIIIEKLVVIGIQEFESEGYKFGEGDYVEFFNEIFMEYFEMVVVVDSRISFVYFGDKYGNMFIYLEQEFFEGYDLCVRFWYQEVVKVGKGVWSDFYQDVLSGKWVVIYVVFIYCNGELIGVIGFDVFIDIFVNEIKSVKVGEIGYVYVVNEDGFIIVYLNEQYVMKFNVFEQESFKLIVDIVRSGKDSGVVMYEWQGVKVIVVGYKIFSMGWYVFIKVLIVEVIEGVMVVIRIVQDNIQKIMYMMIVFFFL